MSKKINFNYDGKIETFQFLDNVGGSITFDGIYDPELSLIGADKIKFFVNSIEYFYIGKEEIYGIKNEYDRFSFEVKHGGIKCYEFIYYMKDQIRFIWK